MCEREAIPLFVRGMTTKTSSININALVMMLIHLERSPPGVILTSTSTVCQYYILADTVATEANHI